MRKLLLFALSLAGLFDSLYLWWVYTSPTHPMVCLGTGCDVVRASSYANFAGHPLPSYGTGMYAALAVLILAEVLVSGNVERGLRFAVAGLAAAGFLVSLYLTAIEAVVLHAWCAWCVVSALTVTLILILAILDLVRPARQPSVRLTRHEHAVTLRPIWTYMAVLGAALILGTPAFFFLSRQGQLAPIPLPSGQGWADYLVRPDSHVAGNPGASVTVVEFADFECPYCGRAEETTREIRKKFGGEIRFVFRHFPQPALHPYAEKAAEASECAAEQGKFWQAAEKFYDRRSNLSPAALEGYAHDLGLDMGRFDQCLSSGRMAARVKQDANDARALGIRATPTFIIGRQMILGAPDLTKFTQLVEQEIKSHGVSIAQSPTSSRVSPETDTSTQPLPPVGEKATDPNSAAPNLLAGSGGGVFSQFQVSGMSCNEQEAAKQQPTLIRTAEARKLFEGEPKALFVDVRLPREFAAGRIRGALNLPVDEIEQRWSQLPTNRTVVLYESGKSSGDICAAGRAAGRVLLSHGFARERVRVYQDGLAAWEKESLPVEH